LSLVTCRPSLATCHLPLVRLDGVLGFVVAGFAAVGAVVLAVFGEADAIIGVAQKAVAVAFAAVFRLAADTAEKDFSGHGSSWRRGADCRSSGLQAGTHLR